MDRKLNWREHCIQNINVLLYMLHMNLYIINSWNFVHFSMNVAHRFACEYLLFVCLYQCRNGNKIPRVLCMWMTYFVTYSRAIFIKPTENEGKRSIREWKKKANGPIELRTLFAYTYFTDIVHFVFMCLCECTEYEPTAHVTDAGVAGLSVRTLNQFLAPE